jgi:hypothetical protein
MAVVWGWWLVVAFLHEKALNSLNPASAILEVSMKLELLVPA